MIRRTAPPLPAVAIALLTGVACGPSMPSADLVLTGGQVVTLDPATPRAEAIAVTGDRITAIGREDEIAALVGTGTRVVQLDGRTVVPGFIDAHVHFVGMGSRLLQLDARGRSKEEIVRLVAQRVADAGAGEWITGRSWDQTLWDPPAFPTKEELDAVAPDNPVYLGRVDGHAGWANSAALALAGITRDTPDPAGGQIVRDARGEPTGTLIDNAFRLVSSLVPPLTLEQKKRAIALAIAECHSVGLTSVHEAGGFREDIELYEALMREGRFDLRIYEFLRWPVNEQQLPHTYEALDPFLQAGPRIGLHDNRLTIRGIKMSVDGALGSRGAALLEPFADDPGNRGVFRLTADEVYATIVRGLRAGFQITVHAIGDAANRLALDAMERALGDVPTPDARLRVEHAQILHPDDVPRFAALGIVPSMQPSHQTTDMRWAEERIGPERARYAYAWRSLLDSGVRIAGGSDAPVEPADPIAGIYAAVTRQDAEGRPPDGWHPRQRVTREEALRMFTIDAAYSVFEEDLKGTLSPGKLADLVVLSQDILAIPARDILDTRVDYTIFGGRIVHERVAPERTPTP